MDLTVELLTIRGTDSTNPWPPGPLENKIQALKKPAMLPALYRTSLPNVT